MKKELAALKKRLQDGTWEYFALCSTDGATLIPVSHGKKDANRKAADLDHIFEVIADYPEEDLVINAYLTKAKTSKPKSFPVPGSTKTLDSLPVLSQANSTNIQAAERLGSLETENLFLKEKIEELKKQLAEYESLANEDEAIEEEDDLFEDEPKQTIMDFVAPAIPGLLDKATALLDIYINKKLVGTNGNFENIQPTRVEYEKPEAPVLELDYDKLADLVAKKLEQNGNY
jgi:hypothetical protein